jgi:hypothetical protein
MINKQEDQDMTKEKIEAQKQALIKKFKDSWGKELSYYAIDYNKDENMFTVWEETQKVFFSVDTLECLGWKEH